MTTYECPFCTKQISDKSKKCPHCQEWLKPGNWHYQNPHFQIFYVILVAVVTYLSINFVETYVSKPKKNYFMKGLTNLHVISDKVVRNGQRLYISGQVKNEDDVEWRYVQVQAKYFNKAGEEIDESSDHINIQKGQTQNFRIEFNYFDKSDHKLYERYEIEIIYASDYT